MRTATVKRDRAGEWRYNVRSGSNIIDSSEGYTRRRDAVRAVKLNRPDVRRIEVCNRFGKVAKILEVDPTIS